MDTDTSCCVCWQSFQEVDPVILVNCGHTLCRTCAERVGREHSYMTRFEVKCPFCQQSSIYARKSDIKSNYTLRGVMAALQEESGDVESLFALLAMPPFYQPKKLSTSKSCRSCSWYLALQSKFVCSYCGDTFCSKCSDAHIQKEKARYTQAQGEVKLKVQQTKALLELRVRTLEKRCKQLEASTSSSIPSLSPSSSSSNNTSTSISATKRTPSPSSQGILVFVAVVVAYVYIRFF